MPLTSISFGLFQSTHLSRGATNSHPVYTKLTLIISIHAPLTRCDVYNQRDAADGVRISIHAPLTRCDSKCSRTASRTRHFNPRTSHEVRPHTRQSRSKYRHFNPRTSHEVRLRAPTLWPSVRHFNPRTSHEVRLIDVYLVTGNAAFQSTHLSRGATTSLAAQRSVLIFQSTHLSRGATDNFR